MIIIVMMITTIDSDDDDDDEFCNVPHASYVIHICMKANAIYIIHRHVTQLMYVSSPHI
jgi:hypothetical protein